MARPCPPPDRRAESPPKPDGSRPAKVDGKATSDAGSGTPGQPPRIPCAFYQVSAANFLFFVNFSFFFLLPLWVLEHGGGEEIAGRVAGIGGLAGLAALPLIGYLLDRFGRRRFLLTGGAGAVLCSLAYLSVDAIGPQLYLLRAAQGVAFTLAFTGAQTLAVLFAPSERRAEALGWFGISTITPQAFAPGLGEEVIRRFGFDALFALGALVALAALALASTIPPPPALTPAAGELPTRAGAARRAVSAAAVTMLCYGFAFGATLTFVPVLMTRLELGRVGWFFAAWSLAAVGIRVVAGSASDRFGRVAVLLPAMVLMTSAVVALSMVRTLPGILATGLAFGSAQGLLYPTMNALVADWSTPANIGRNQSIFSGSYSMGIATCSFFFGSVAEHHGYTVMFLSAAAISAIGLVIFALGSGEAIRSKAIRPG